MVDNQVVITYKRKRCSSQSGLRHGTGVLQSSSDSPSVKSSAPSRSSTSVEFDDCNVNQNKESLPIAEGKWQCSTCHRKNEFVGSPQHILPDFRRGRKKRKIQELEMGAMELHSQKVLSSIKIPEDCSRKASSLDAHSASKKTKDSNQMELVNDKSGLRPEITQLDVETNLVCLNSCTEAKPSSVRFGDSRMLTVNSNKIDEQHPKEKSTPLITFHRRAKKKQVGSEKFAEQNSISEKKQQLSTISSGPAEVNFVCDGSSQICSFKDQLTGAGGLLEQAEMANVGKDGGLKSASGGGFAEMKNVADGCKVVTSHKLQEASISNQNPLRSPSAHVRDTEDHLNKSMAAPAADVIKNSILIQYNNKPNSVKITTPLGEESGNNLCITKSNEGSLSHDAPEKRRNLSELEPSVVPSGSITNDVQSVLTDEGTDGKGKELEWLEDLERVLQDRQKSRGKYPYIEQVGVSCGQSSGGRASPTVLTKSSLNIASNQGASSDCTNQTALLEEKPLLTKLGKYGCEKQQHEETSNRSLCTDFLGLSLPLNPGTLVASAKDVQASSSGVKNNVHVSNRQVPWYSSEETSSFLRHKQMVENSITGTRILKERQNIMVENMFRKYSHEWSEEELDFLWIGVRRYGASNWNTVLKDPKLQFLKSRTAEDLAMQWDVEQRKLLTGTLMQPSRFPRADFSSPSVVDDTLFIRPYAGSHSAWSHVGSEFPMAAGEPKLSLGDLCRKRRSLFRSSGVSLANQLRSESSSTGSFLGGFPAPVLPSSRQIPVRTQNIQYDWMQSISQQPGEKLVQEHQFFGLSANTGLPHWLKEVANDKDTKTIGSSQPLFVTNTACSLDLINGGLQLTTPYKGEPSALQKDPRGRGILKRKRVAKLKISEVPNSVNEPWKADAKISLQTTTDVVAPENKCLYEQNKSSPDEVGPNDMVVIDCDASSEETISDDQNSRPN